MTKRIFSALLAVVLAVGACGCAQSNADTNSQITTQSTPETTISEAQTTTTVATTTTEIPKTETETEETADDLIIPTNYYSGTLDENKNYVNFIFGFQGQMGENWLLVPDTGYKNVNNMPGASYEDFKKSLDENGKIEDFCVYCFNKPNKEDIKGIIALDVLKDDELSGFSEKELVSGFLSTMNDDESQTNTLSTKQFAGKEHYCVETVYKSDNKSDSYQNIFFLQSNDLIGMLIFTSSSQQDMDNLIGTFTSYGEINTEETALLENKNIGVEIYDDEYVTISYLECETSGRNEYMVFYVINKTDFELSFQSSSLAINGESLGDVSGSDDIAPMSKGKIRFRTEEDFPALSPNTISGVISVIDFSRTIFNDNKMSYDVKFINVEV